MLKHTFFTRIFVLIFIFLSSFYAHASAKDDFSKGIALFKKNNYSAAINFFKKVEESTPASAALYFNLGSSYYKNKQYKKAETYFKKLTVYPKMRAIAIFNMALVNKTMRNNKTAKKQFKWVIKKSHNKKLISLAVRQIKSLKAIALKNRKQKSWSHYASLTLGNDSNINVAPDGTALERADSFTTLFLKTTKLLSGTSSHGWLANVSLFRFDYSTVNANSSSQYSASLTRSLKFNGWRNKFNAQLLKSTYGGSDYQTRFTIEASGIKKLSKNNKLKFRFRYYDINSNNIIYDYLEGNKQQFRAELKHSTSALKQRFYYEYEINNRQDTATLSYSPVRHTLKAIHTIKTSKKIHWGGEVSYRQSDYPVVAVINRDSIRWKYGLFGIYRFDKTTKLKARIVYTDNQSDSTIYEYNKDVVSLSFSKLF